VTDEPALRPVLEKFARDITSSGGAREAVSVEVMRIDGFRNEAVTPRGLKVCLDEPVNFGGKGEAPDPAEHLLAAVGASVSVTLTAHAALRDVPIDRVHVVLRAEIDGREFFRPGSGGMPGLLDIVMELTVRSSAPRAMVRALLRDVLRAAPVLRSLKRLPKVTIQFDDAAASLASR